MNTNENTTGLMMQAFDFEDNAVRIVIQRGEPWFVATDVCRVLGLTNSRRACEKLDADEKGVTLSDTLGGQQKMTIISESGLYTLILRCDDAIKPGTVAHRFRKWVTAEVLPALRKEGAYGLAAVRARGELSEIRELLISSARAVRDKMLDVGRAQQIANLAARYLETVKLEGDALGYEAVFGVRGGEGGGGVLPQQGAGAERLQAMPQQAVFGAGEGLSPAEAAAIRGEEAVGEGEPAAGEASPGQGDLSRRGADAAAGV